MPWVFALYSSKHPHINLEEYYYTIVLKIDLNLKELDFKFNALMNLQTLKLESTFSFTLLFVDVVLHKYNIDGDKWTKNLSLHSINSIESLDESMLFYDW